MEIKNLILIIIAVINFFLATLILFKDKKSPINTSFALVFYGGGLWSFGIGMFMHTTNMENAIGWAKIYYFASAIIALAFLVFANYYLYKIYDLDIVKIFYILFPFLIVSFIIFHPTFLIESATHYSWGNDANEKFLAHLFFAVYFFVYVAWGFKLLFKKLKSSDGINKKRIFLVVWGTLISFIFGAAFDLILPLVGYYKLVWFGPYFTVIAFIFLTYLIFYKSSK